MNMERQPHATTELASRRLKALRIERLLGLQPVTGPLRLLEIGCGSGGISHYFATHPTLNGQVVAVDVHDNRRVREGYRYVPVQGVELPFADASFDVAISNHVIEQVGGVEEQLLHLREMRRVLRPGGIAYLAVPNRWMIEEPHYRLKFLSWLPRNWRTPYLRLRGRGNYYDCEPLQRHELESMLQRSGMSHRSLCIEGMRATFDIERPTAIATRLLARVPDAMLIPFRSAIPTLIYRLERAEQ